MIRKGEIFILPKFAKNIFGQKIFLKNCLHTVDSNSKYFQVKNNFEALKDVIDFYFHTYSRLIRIK